MQTSYDLDFAVAAFPGQLADSGPHDVMSGQSLRTPSKLFTITVANSTEYQLTFEQGTTDATVAYTSDASATKAEIVAGLLAATPSVALKDWALVNHGGDLVAVMKPGVISPRAITNTGAGTIAVSALSPEIAFGVAVSADATTAGNPLSVRLPNATGDKIYGIALSTHFMESLGRFASDPTAAPAYPAGSSINVCRAGRVYVKVEAAVTAGGSVYFRHAANGSLTQLGAIRGDTDSGNATLLAGAIFLDSASASGYARVQLNLP